MTVSVNFRDLAFGGEEVAFHCIYTKSDEQLFSHQGRKWTSVPQGRQSGELPGSADTARAGSLSC